MARASASPIRILTVFGTRPEAIKLAPVILELQSRPEFESIVAVTGQHREILDQMLSVFGVVPDYDLEVMQERHSLASLTSRIIERLDLVFTESLPDFVLVQGDTTTSFTGALVAFYHQIPVGHVEAGLRTRDKWQPFPEEINRRLCDAISDLYFAPTPVAKANLISEGVGDRLIAVTGNTVIDALIWMQKQLPNSKTETRKSLLVTAHRRESWGQPMRGICEALLRLVEQFPDFVVDFPVHPNPAVREIVEPLLGGHPRIRLMPPLDYVEFVQAMSKAMLILTDSGGIQEEAPTLNVPVLVLRDTTERPEAVESGAAILVGTNPEEIFAKASELLTNDAMYKAMASVPNPFGDGQASKRIADSIVRFFGRELPEG